MDTSETRIKMCEKAEEIQVLRREERHRDTGKWQEGDFYTTIFRDGVSIVHHCNDAWADEPHYLHHPIECIWLPLQYQLQEMVEFTTDGLHGFTRWCQWGYGSSIFVKQPYEIFTSMEQLWLAAIMDWKFNKRWDGENWIDES